MTRRFCDCCDKEIRGPNVTSERVTGTTTVGPANIKLEIRCGVGRVKDPTLDVGDLCQTCLRSAIDKLLRLQTKEPVAA